MSFFRPPGGIFDINREQDYAKNSGGILGEHELRPPSQPHYPLETTETGLISEQIFETVPLSTDSLFQRAISVLHTAYLDSASGLGFQYNQVTLVKNDIFLNEYKHFHQEKKANNYTQEELEETYGFLLFQTEKQAKLACQRGLCVGSSAVTTLGDPARGVYISKYSDYLHARPWYHGKSGYIVVFKLIKGKVKFVSENYTTNYTSPSSGYDCHVATDANKVSQKTSHFRTFELSQYYLYELAGSTVTQRPRQICPYVIVAFQYREPKKMATPAPQSILELSENVLTTQWKGKLTIQGCLLCDVTLWPFSGAVIPEKLSHELDFKYLMKVSSLKKRLPEAAFRKQNDLKQRVFCQDICFSIYEVELSNKQGKKIDKLTKFMKNKQLAIIKSLEDRGFFILLTSSALISETDFGDRHTDLWGLHLFHSPLLPGLNVLKVENDISLKVMPILPVLNCVLLEAKKAVAEGVCPNTLVKRSFQELHRMDRSTSSTASPQDGVREAAFSGQPSSDLDLMPPAEKCPLQSFAQLQSYFSNPSGYVLEVSAALDLLAERPQSPCVSDGICDAGFSLVMTPDSEFLDVEADVRKETEPEDSEDTRQEGTAPLSTASNLRVQPKRKASMPHGVQSEKVNLCRPCPKRTPPAPDKAAGSATTLKLIKGQFPQKRKRGAEVLTAQFVQTTKLDRKSQEAPFTKDAPVTANAKKTKKQEKTPSRSVPKAKPPVKKPPQKPVKDNQTPRGRKQPQPAKRETASQLQSEVTSDGQADVTINTAQPGNTTVTQKDPPEDSIVNCDSLNMLADLALSSATSSTSSSDPRNPSELPQSDVSLPKELSSRGTSDHEYHKGVKSLKGGLSPKLSSGKSNLLVDSGISLEETGVFPANDAQPSLPEETVGTSEARPGSFVAAEHSYALLLAEHSKKHLQQRGAPSPAFAKNSTKGPEAGTPVGKVMPFRHQQSTAPLQKLPEDSSLKHKNRLVSPSLHDFSCSHTVFSCDGSLKVTLKCETEYLFSLDSKYTNNPLEKTVIRALHGPWNTDLPDSVDEVKLLLHMWVALFYSNQNKVIHSSRRVVEHSNPAKYVSIHSTLESLEFSEIEEPLSVERCSADPLLETNVTPTGHTAEVSFSDPNTVISLINPPAARGLGLWIQNEQEEMFARENHRDTPGNQNFIYSCNSEIIGQVATESADTPETASLLLSGIASTQPCIPGEDQSFTPLDSARVTSYSDTVRQTAATKTYSGTGGQSVTYPKTVYSALENKVDIFHAVEQTHTGALEDLLRNSSPIDKDFDKADSTGYVLINLEPATLTYVPIQAEVGSRIDKPLSLTLELTEQVLHSATLGHSVPSLEKTQAPVLRNISSVLGSEQSTNYLCASSASKALAGEMCSLQAEIPTPDSTLTSDTSLVAEALPLMKSAKHSVPAQEMMISQELLLQSQCVHSLPSEEVRELSQVEEVVSATLQKNHSLSCLPSPTNISNDALHLKNKSGMDGENTNRESFRSTLSKQTGLSVSREEANPRGPEDPDIDLILTITPSKSREERPSGKIEQRQEAPLANRELQSVAKEITESGKTAFRDNREVSCAPCTVGKPLENEQSNRNLAPVTLFPEETWTLEEITEEVNISSGLPFGSFIEEVSPVSSPDPLLPAAEARPPQTVCPATLKLSDTQCEKSDTLPQPESEGLTLTEEGNASIGPAPLGGQDTLTQEVPAQLCAGSPPGLSDHPGGKDLVPSGKVTTEIVPEIFSEKVPCHNKDSNQPALADSYREDLGPSVEKTVTSRNPPQLLSVEKNHLDVKSLVSETSELPVSPRKMKESETLTAEFVPADRLNVSFKQQTSPRDAEKALSSGDSKTHEDSYLQVSTLSSCSRGEVACALAHTSSGSPRQACPPSDGPPHGHCGGREFQTREISVVRMASLLKNCETEAEVREQNRGLRSIGSQSSFMPPEDEPDPRHVVQDIPACAAEALKGGFFPVYTGSYQNTAGPAPSISEEPSASFAPEACDPPICGVFQELEGNKNPEGGLTLEEELGTLTEGVAVSANFDIHHEPISEDSDKGSCDCGSPKSDVEDPCTLQHRCTKKEGPLKEDCDSFLHLHTNDNEDWDYPPQTPGLETSIPSRNWYLGLKQEEKYRPSYIQIRDLRGIPRTYANFTITKQLQDTTRTLHSLGRQPDRTAHCSLLSSWIDSWHVSDDLTQNTLDMEYLRFAHSMKQTAKGRDPPRSASSTKLFARESPLHISAAAFPLTERPESQLLHPAARSRSPLLITVTHSDARQQNLPRRDRRPTSLGSPSFWMEKDDHCQNHFMNLDRSPTVPLHLNKLRYNSTSKDSRNDISLILSEYAEFDKVVMNSSPAVFPGKGASVSRGPTPQELCSSFPRKAASYEDMITDLCTSLHVKLKHVMKEACKSTFLFYLVETGDKSFFVRTKIPSLLRLKHCANVIFAGVDSPEDILEYSYQELFQTGGFVVSDDKILETLSLVQLKEVVKTLEKLNGNGRWKWLLHYREHKKLKECGRVDSAARKKNTILKSCQSVNIVELLHYHQCDSRSAAKGEYLNCLLSLQTQHIHARFAVFLTEKPMVSREVFENSGILVTDVSNFVENIQKVAAPLRSSCW
ncbi:protein TASOR 2 isoform X3 [Erinaceus europaeus]|uniref:Protein TASOR 2 isoform X3 n=1 Tax=Erinaceus europaeus TaxID=9365 RepID=A0ABM3XHS8_ERIEU|nr:protein TASOR 2 isoform X3 [Erinaceus europaeus]